MKDSKVIQGAIFKTRSYRKAMLLFGVYVLHLVFFQALMQAAPNYNMDCSFKPLFNVQQTHVNHSPSALKHPAVTYYSILVKQMNYDGGGSNPVAPAVGQARAIVNPVLLAALYQINQTSIGQLHLADDIFKVYRLIQVFLI